MGNKGFIFSSLFFPQTWIPNFSGLIFCLLSLLLLSTVFLQTRSENHFWITLLWVPSCPPEKQQMAPGTLCSVSSHGRKPKLTQLFSSGLPLSPLTYPHFPPTPNKLQGFQTCLKSLALNSARCPVRDQTWNQYQCLRVLMISPSRWRPLLSDS